MAVWKPLGLSSKTTALPKLYIKHEVSEQGYEIALTDLSCLWNERLDWREVVQRSLNDGTTIDLLEPDQHRIFITYMQNALEGGEHTTLALFQGHEPSHLTLRLGSKLPGGFQPLQWHVQLIRQSPNDLAEQLTVPALIAFQEAQDASKELARLLSEKDQVIETLMAKIKNIGIPLEDLFPRVVPITKGRRAAKPDESLFYKKVPGLQKFEPGEFHDLRLIRQKPGKPSAQDDLLKDGLDCTHSPQWKAVNEWWHGLPPPTEQPELLLVPDSQPKPPSLPYGESTHDFEVSPFVCERALSELLQSQRSLDANQTSLQWQMTTREADDVEQRVNGKASMTSPAPTTNDANRAVQRIAALSSEPARPVASLDDATTISDSQGQTQQYLERRPHQRHFEGNTHSPQKRLGKIGGKKRAELVSSPSIEQEGASRPRWDAGVEKEPTRSPPLKPRGKIGRIGGMRQRKTPEAPNRDDHASVSPKVEAVTPPRVGDNDDTRNDKAPSPIQQAPKRETSQERKARVRAQAKQETEGQGRAAPRKKRKF